MVLSKAVKRELLHRRVVAIDGYRRADGLYDIEASITDTKTYSFANDERGLIPAGEPLHRMLLRLTVDEELHIVAAEAATEFAPFAICPGAAPAFAALAGLKIGPGFLKAVGERVGGAAGCTHIRELLQQVGTVAFQTVQALRRARAAGDVQAGKALVNSCYAFAETSPVVRRRWPELYKGDNGP